MTRRPPRLPECPSFGDLRSCPGKVIFFERRVAKRRASELRKAEGGGIHAYRCSACGYWHVGHEAGRATEQRHEDRFYQLPPQRPSVSEGGV